MVMREVHGTITPGRIARIALECYDDAQWIAATGERLGSLYRDHVGAADRMAESLLTFAG